MNGLGIVSATIETRQLGGTLASMEQSQNLVLSARSVSKFL